MSIGGPHAVRPSLGVAHVVAKLGAFAANFTLPGHDHLPFGKITLYTAAIIGHTSYCDKAY